MVYPADYVDNREDLPVGKQGSKCCGCCCDYKRAVIACAIVEMCWKGLTLLSLGIYWRQGANDDYYHGAYNPAYDDLNITATVSSILSLLMGAGAIWGAINYNVIAVGINAGWIISAWLIDISLKYVWYYIPPYSYEELVEDDDAFRASRQASLIFSFFFMALFVYPHVGFIIEVKKGILSRATYARERYSCCCISNPPVIIHQYQHQQPLQPVQARAAISPPPVETALYPTQQAADSVPKETIFHA